MGTINGDLYIDPVFDKNQWGCWSANTVEGSSKTAWFVSFDVGFVNDDFCSANYHVRAVRARHGAPTPDVTAAPTREPTPQPSEIPAVIKPPVKLRDNPKALSEEDVKAMLKKHNFFDSDWNKTGSFENDFVDNGNGTVTDRKNGLMWQKSGSENYIEFKDADEYVRQVNQKRLGDYDDWRLPTLEELTSLLETKKMSGDLYIDPVFDAKQRWCRSADTVEGSSDLAWVIYFGNGNVHHLYGFLINYSYVRVVRAGQ